MAEVNKGNDILIKGLTEILKIKDATTLEVVIKMGKLGLDLDKDFDRKPLEEMRQNIRELIDSLKGNSNEHQSSSRDSKPEKEKIEVLKLLEGKYEPAFQSIKNFGLYDEEKADEREDKKCPSMETVKNTLIKKLTLEQLEVISAFENPVMLLCPVTSSDRYIQSLNSLKPMKDQDDAFLDNWQKKALQRADQRDSATEKITGWKVVICEGANSPKVLKGENVNDTLEERFKWFETDYAPKGVKGMTLKQNILLQMQGLSKNPPRPVDDLWGKDKTLTMCNGEPIHNKWVAGANWSIYNLCQIYLRGYHYLYRYNNARLRPVMELDVD